MKFKNQHSGKDLNIFCEIADLAVRHDAVNLAQGSPDYELDGRLKDFLMEATHHDMNPYASRFVLPFMKENLLRFNLKRMNPIHVTEDEISIVPGATYGMHVALASFLEPGDEVIILEPCYDTYIPAVEIRRAVPVYVPMPENSVTDWEKIRDSVTDRTSAIIVNSPHNPSGKVWSRNDWDQLWDIIKETSIVVISDEVYDLICYDGREFQSAFHHPEIRKRCFCIFSFEKMFHISGWKASYLIAPEEFTEAFRRIHQYLSFTVNAHAQFALGKYLEVFDTSANGAFFQKKRDLFCELLADLPLEVTHKAEGGYFQTVRFNKERFPYSDKEFSEMLIRQARVSSIPYSAFYHDQHETGNIRFCFAKKDETLIRAADHMHHFFKGLS